MGKNSFCQSVVCLQSSCPYVHTNSGKLVAQHGTQAIQNKNKMQAGGQPRGSSTLLHGLGVRLDMHTPGDPACTSKLHLSCHPGRSRTGLHVRLLPVSQGNASQWHRIWHTCLTAMNNGQQMMIGASMLSRVKPGGVKL